MLDRLLSSTLVTTVLMLGSGADAQAQTGTLLMLDPVYEFPNYDYCLIPCAQSVAVAGHDVIVVHGGESPVTIFSPPTSDTEVEWSRRNLSLPTPCSQPEGGADITPYFYGVMDLVADSETVLIPGTIVKSGAQEVRALLIYRKCSSDWQLTQTIELKESLRVDDFAVAGDRFAILVRDTEDLVQASSVFVYEHHSGSFRLEDDFEVNGSTLALDGDLLVVGSSDHGASGGAYVYQHHCGQWVLQEVLTPSLKSQAEQYPAYGSAVAVSGRWIAVGDTSYVRYTPRREGVVYLYQIDTENVWHERKRLFDPHPLVDGDTVWTYRRFGDTLAMRGPWLMTGTLPPYRWVTDAPLTFLSRLEKGKWKIVGEFASYLQTTQLALSLDYAAISGWSGRFGDEVPFFEMPR